MGEKIIRKLQDSGKYSKVLVIPRSFLRKLHWRAEQNLELELEEKQKRIIIRDAKSK